MATDVQASADEQALAREAEQELFQARWRMWSGFVRLSTYIIVFVALLLILMAVFLV